MNIRKGHIHKQTHITYERTGKGSPSRERKLWKALFRIATNIFFGNVWSHDGLSDYIALLFAVFLCIEQMCVEFNNRIAQ